MKPTTLSSLPVELIADIMGELDLDSLIKLSQMSRQLQAIVSDPSLNPWRRPILRNLRSASYGPLTHLSVRQTVPRHNWIEILSLASPAFILYDATLPNLKDAEWEECFNRRFLPGWKKWKREGSWKQVFIQYVLASPRQVDELIYNRMLFRVLHRSTTSCTTEETWTKLGLIAVINRSSFKGLLIGTSY